MGGLSKPKKYWSRVGATAQIPREGQKACPIALDFSADTTFTLASILTQRAGFLSLIATLFIDNSANPGILEIDVDVINQALKVPAASQAYLPILAPTNASFEFRSTGGGLAFVDLINVPLPAVVWSTPAPSPPGALILLESGASGVGPYIQLESGAGRIALE